MTFYDIFVTKETAGWRYSLQAHEIAQTVKRWRLKGYHTRVVARKRHFDTDQNPMYGFIDLANPRCVYMVGSLSRTWKELKHVRNCGIIRLSDGKLIFKR